jgi:phosphonate transport system substrate-binding protein
MRSRALTTFATVLAASCLLAGCGSAGPGEAAEPAAGGGPATLVFAAIPTEESDSLQEKYSLVLKVIEEETGLAVQFRNATDYAAVIEAQRSGQVQLALFGPFSYVSAKDTGVDTIPLAVAVEDPTNPFDAYSYGFAKPGSGIEKIDDLKGKTVCFVDPSSTSGYLYATAAMMELGLDPETDITAMFAGGHDSSVLTVLSGQCDAGFANKKIITTTLPEKGLLKAGEVNIFWESEPLPGSPMAMSGSLPADLQAKLADVFGNKLNRPWLAQNGYCDSEEACQLPSAKTWGYVAMSDSDYDGIRKVCKQTQAAACTGE